MRRFPDEWNQAHEEGPAAEARIEIDAMRRSLARADAVLVSHPERGERGGRPLVTLCRRATGGLLPVAVFARPMGEDGDGAAGVS